MPFYNFSGIKYYQFDIFKNLGVIHAVFTRRGGVSPAPWASLNFGASVGDESHRVATNREMALDSIGIDPSSVYDVFQIHSTDTVVASRPREKAEVHIKADAILTDQPNVTLMMRFADCVPILLFDPQKRAIGIIHAGWIGTVNKIVNKAILEMMRNYGTLPNELIAAVGPSIGPDHYAIGGDVVDRIHSSFGEDANELIINRNGNEHFNLWKANKLLLSNAGVKEIEIAEICTCCNLDDWYSHRGEYGKTGRFGVVFRLSS